MKRRAVLAVGFALALGLGGGWLASSQAQSRATPTQPPPAAALATSGSFAKLAEAVKPAVINVSSQTKQAAGRTPLEDYLEEFYGKDLFRRFFGDGPGQVPRRGLGSGVIIDPSGIALTNAHVVAGATSIEVVTVDGAKHEAKVLGSDKTTDLAVLQLDGGEKTFPYVPLGDSDETQVGEWVIAVGSPFGLQATVTSGIISAKARQIGAGPYDDFLQTDAAINPGNSGGPLVNMRGEVVGINTAIVRGASGIGFAIPSNLAKRVATELRTSGKVTRGWLGVTVQPITADLATAFGVKDGEGALIADVTAGSPAARAGLKPGDVVVRFDGDTIESAGDLARAVGFAKPGGSSRLMVWRDGRQHTIDVKLGEAPAEGGVAAARERGAAGLGVEVRPVTPEDARERNLKATTGVVVAAVKPGGPAAEAGLRRGDVIVEIDRKAVKSVEDFEKLASHASGKAVLLRVQRGDGTLYVAMAPAKD